MKSVLKKKLNKKGFTLAELLVVVAIIAVLIAIAIPVFNASTKKAEEAVEVANARACYAQGMVNVVSGEYTSGTAMEGITYGNKTYTFKYTDPSGSETEGTWEVTVAMVSGETGTPYNEKFTNATSGTTFENVVIDGK